MGTGTIILLCLAAVALIIVLWIISFYNKVVKESAKIENSWGQIDVQLKLRADVIPNVVNTVAGYAHHEKDTLDKVIQARNRYVSAQTQDEAIEASNQLSGTLSRLFAVAEQYPDLKANQGFLELQRQLHAIEEKIATYRQFYNDIVLRYNRMIIPFPAVILARRFKFEQKPYFKVDEQDRQSPKVQF